MIDQTIFKDKKVAFCTLGCKLNFAETSYIGKLLLEHGFRMAKQSEKADVCIINTCSVTQMADRKDRQTIKQMIAKHPNAYVIVVGCYAQLKPDVIASIEGVDLVLGMQDKFNIIDHIENLEKEKQARISHTQRKDISSFTPLCTQGERTRFFLKVQDGCDNFCSYCTVPIARGKSRNAPISDTVKKAMEAAGNGAKEIVISGVNIGDFGKTTGESFLGLIQELDKVDGVERYRISSIEPDLLTNDIIDFVANSQKFVPHFHIPLQSGSDDVLALMKRHYKRELFAEKVSNIKQIMPDAFIGVDVIVGTNGETNEFFEDSYRFIDSLDVSQLHVFSYSERPNTQALYIKGSVHAKEKKERSERLLSLSEIKRKAFYSSQVGKVARVLWEESHNSTIMHGFTENYIRVEREYDKSLVNTISSVTLCGFNMDESSLKVKV